MSRTKPSQGLAVCVSRLLFFGLEVTMADLFWLSDEQRAVIEPFMHRDQAGPERTDNRQITSGARYDRLATNYLAAVCLAATVSYWL